MTQFYPFPIPKRLTSIRYVILLLASFLITSPLFAQPNITAFTPTSAAQDSIVTITGTNFTGATAVSFGGTPAASFVVVSPTTIRATVGRGTSGNVSVTTPGGSTAIAGFTFLLPPVITSMVPASNIGRVISITGSGFTGTTSISIGGLAGHNFQIISDTHINLLVQPRFYVNEVVVLTSPAGTAVFNNFVFLPTPWITNFSPSSGGPGTEVNIRGEFFMQAIGPYKVQGILFGNEPAASHTIISDFEINAVVGQGASGAVSLVTENGLIPLSGFTFIPNSLSPAVTSFTPTTAGAGTTIKIIGRNFRDASAVSFGGTSATSFTVVSDTLINAVVAQGSTGHVKVSTPTDTAMLAGFTFTPAVQTPSITSFIPASATTGDTIRIYGTNFNDASFVSLGNITADTFAVISNSEILAVVGHGATGNVNVTTPSGTASHAGFTFIPPALPPTIFSFTPTSATTGSTITIRGRSFNNTSGVFFGGTAAASFAVVSDSVITAVVAQGSSGMVRIDFDPHTSSYLGDFTFIPPVQSLSIHSFTPASAATGTTVNIRGRSFSGVTGVFFGGTAAASYTVVSDTVITAVVAQGATGHVKVAKPTDTASLAGFTYIPPVQPPLSITSFTPTSAGTGTTVTIRGKSFGGVSFVSFGGTNAASFAVTSDSTITAVIAQGTSGHVKVAKPSDTASLAGFTYIPPVQPPLTITSFTPTSAATGSTVTIRGKSFGDVSFVSFGGTNAASFAVTNDSTITAVIAQGASGHVKVAKPSDTASLAGFTYIPPVQPPLTITSFTPASAATGSTVTIHGKSFGGVSLVSFGGTTAASFNIVSDSVITAVVGQGATGRVKVVKASDTASLAGFTFISPVQPLSIKSFTPTSTGTGSTVTIRGKSFVGVSFVSFGGITASSYSIVNDSVITAIVGQGASGNVKVAKPSDTASLAGFTYVPSVQTLLITSFTPTSATTGGTVTIRGKLFNGVSIVSFGGTTAASFNVVNDSTISAVVGQGASGRVKVTKLSDTASLAGFTYIPPVQPLSVTSFTPASANTGTTITIRGKGLNAVTAVSFGGTNATTFSIVNDSTITAVVGQGSTGNVKVETPSTAASLAGFTYIVPAPALSVTSFLPVFGDSGTVVIIRGKSFTGASAVSFGGTASLSFSIMSDSVIAATVGGGSTGAVRVLKNGVGAELSGFTFVNSKLKEQVAIFPNPSIGNAWIDHPVTNNKAQLQIVNLQGNVLKTMNVETGAPRTQISLSGIPPGLYRVVWSDGTTTISKAVMVMQ